MTLRLVLCSKYKEKSKNIHLELKGQSGLILVYNTPPCPTAPLVRRRFTADVCIIFLLFVCLLES